MLGYQISFQCVIASPNEHECAALEAFAISVCICVCLHRLWTGERKYDYLCSPAAQ